MRLLVINPNTSEFVTNAVARAARQAALPDTEVVAVTGKRGAPIITGRTENALGAVESINLAAEHAEGCDAVLLAVSFDSGLKPLRELLNIPVAGMSEAAMLTACMLGGRFALVSFGDRAVHLYRELAFEYGLGERLAGARALPALTQEELESPERVAPRLVEEIGKAVREQGAEAVVLAGAVFAGLSEEIARQSPVPVVDGIAAGVCMAEQLCRLRFNKPRAGSYQLPARKSLAGAAAPLTRIYEGLPDS